MTTIYVEYPAIRYHKTLAPDGITVANASQEPDGEGWVTTPAAFDPGYVPPATRLRDGDPLPFVRPPDRPYVAFPAMRYARDGAEQTVNEAQAATLDPAVWHDHPWTAEEKAASAPPAAVAETAGTVIGAPLVTPAAAQVAPAAPASPVAPVAPAAPAFIRGAVRTPDAPVVQTPLPAIAASLYLLNAAESAMLVRGQDTLDKLADLDTAERAHPKYPGGRTSVFRAIAEAIAALEATQAAR